MNRPWPDTGGRTVYAVGDVHGRDDLLARMLTLIEQDAQAHIPHGRPMIVLLGDYIDRGRHAPRVLDRLAALQADRRFETRLLLGNHEEAMIDMIDGRTTGRGWRRYGGDATMEAYGVRAPGPDEDDSAWHTARAGLAAAVPAHHMALLRGLELAVQVGEVVFVHAGLRPGVPLGEQAREDLIGIRGAFLDAERGDGPFVVHGHTPVATCDYRPDRLNLDTGACLTGRLSGARLDGGEPAILTASAMGMQVRPVSLACAA